MMYLNGSYCEYGFGALCCSLCTPKVRGAVRVSRYSLTHHDDLTLHRIDYFHHEVFFSLEHMHMSPISQASACYTAALLCVSGTSD